MPKLLLLTGPAGVGKNTVANKFAAMAEHCAVVDVDTVRQMLVTPHKAPWEGQEGSSQQKLGVKNAIDLAINFLEEGSDVLLLDVITNETAALYRNGLAGRGLKIVLLLPSFEVISNRNKNRQTKISRDEIALLYDWQKQLKNFDVSFDDSEISAEALAKKLFEI